MADKIITEKYLLAHLDEIFVFGDNLERRGFGGAAKLRWLPNTYGFVTKKSPDNREESFYHPEEYKFVFAAERKKLEERIKDNPKRKFLISRLGAGLANKHKIWELVIKEGLETLRQYPNVEFLFSFSDQEEEKD